MATKRLVARRLVQVLVTVTHKKCRYILHFYGRPIRVPYAYVIFPQTYVVHYTRSLFRKGTYARILLRSESLSKDIFRARVEVPLSDERCNKSCYSEKQR